MNLEQRKAYNQRPEIKTKKREHMKKYNQRPDVIERRRWYYDNVVLPRMCGLLK